MFHDFFTLAAMQTRDVQVAIWLYTALTGLLLVVTSLVLVDGIGGVR